MPLLHCLLLVAGLAVPAPSDDPSGLWWGGIALPDEFETVYLELSPDEAFARVGRPYDGIGAEPMEVKSWTPRLVLERTTDGGSVTLDCAQVEEDLLLGEAHIGDKTAKLVLRRLLALEPVQLDPLLGSYLSESGERIRIERLPIATRHALLACTWTNTQRSRTLFPVSVDAAGAIVFVFGPDFQRAGPTAGSVRFAADGSALEWSDVEGEGEPAERAFLTFDQARIAAFVEDVLARSQAPSISIGVVYGDELVLAESFGVLNRETGEPATPDSLYQIASVTKVFTATLLFALRDQGLVSLDDPAARHLPAGTRFPHGGEGITLRELVTHTSGLRAQPTNYVWNGRHNDDYTAALLYAGLPETSLLFPRGTSWSYSNLGYLVLGQALAGAGGASYEQLLRRHVLDPLGMTDSTITLDEETLARLATHYWDDDPFTPTPPWIPGDIAAQGGLTSSVRDLARFVSASLRDEYVAPGAIAGTSLRELQSPQARRAGGDGWIGLGWFIDHDEARGLYLSHSGFTGGSSSYVALSPALDVGVIVLTNFGFDAAVRVGEWLIEEAVRTARAHIVPAEHEAQTWYEHGDWGNAAWAYGVLAELAPDRSDYGERAQRALRRCD